MFLFLWASLYFGYSFNEAYHTSEFEFIERISFFFSLCSLRGIILEFGFLPYLKLCSWFFNKERQLLMCLHPLRNKWQHIMCPHPLMTTWQLFMRLHLVMNEWQLFMRLHPMMNERQLFMRLHPVMNVWQLFMHLHPVMNDWQPFMRLHPVMNERQLTYFHCLKNYHMLIFFGSFFLRTKHDREVCFSADTYMANREWGSPMPISPCNDKEGRRERQPLPQPILLTTIVVRKPACHTSSPIT